MQLANSLIILLSGRSQTVLSGHKLVSDNTLLRKQQMFIASRPLTCMSKTIGVLVQASWACSSFQNHMCCFPRYRCKATGMVLDQLARSWLDDCTRSIPLAENHVVVLCPSQSKLRNYTSHVSKLNKIMLWFVNPFRDLARGCFRQRH